MISRTKIAALSLSAAALVSLVLHEGYSDRPIVPVAGDKLTIGFGSTEGVRPDEVTTPPKALARTLTHIQKDEIGIKRCVTAELHQVEYDMMVDFAYQYGVPTLCSSSIVKYANRGDYRSSCEAYVLYRFAAGYDCSTPGNKRCWGVWERSKWRRDTCLSAGG